MSVVSNPAFFNNDVMIDTDTDTEFYYTLAAISRIAE